MNPFGDLTEDEKQILSFVAKSLPIIDPKTLNIHPHLVYDFLELVMKHGKWPVKVDLTRMTNHLMNIRS